MNGTAGERADEPEHERWRDTSPSHGRSEWWLHSVRNGWKTPRRWDNV